MIHFPPRHVRKVRSRHAVCMDCHRPLIGEEAVYSVALEGGQLLRGYWCMEDAARYKDLREATPSPCP